MTEKKKKYVVPEAEIVAFLDVDIIAESLADGGEAEGGWSTNDNGENWWS